MKRKLTIILSVLALVLVASVAFGTRGSFSKILADVLGDVPGKVDVFAKDNQNNPLGGVNVETSLDNDSYFLVGITDQTGHLIFNEPDFNSRTRYFRVDFPMYSSAPEVVQVNTAKNTTRNANFVLTPISGTGAVGGKITIYHPGGADNGNPLSSATVRIINSAGSEKGRATSGADGNYQINSIPEGTGYAIYASRAGYEQNSRQGINIVANQTLQNQDLALTPSTGAQPSPSPRASPSASASPSVPQTDRVDLNVRIFSASTDRNISGIPVILDNALDSRVEKITNLNQYNAAFADVQAGRHTLSVNPPSHPNYNSQYEYRFIADLEVRNEVANISAGQDGRQYLEVGLSQRSAYDLLTVIGKITDESGNPISGARVRVFCDGNFCGVSPSEGFSSNSFNRIDRKPEYEYNYLIRNVYNAPQRINRSLRIEVAKDGYILDTNNNNRDDFEEGFQFNINPGTSSTYITSLNSCIAVKSFELKEIPAYRLTIAGKVVNKKNNQLVRGIQVATITAHDISRDKLLPIELKGSKFANYIIKDAPRPHTDSLLVGLEAFGPPGCKFSFNPAKTIEIGKEIVFNQELGYWLGIVNIEMDCGDSYSYQVLENGSRSPIAGAKVELSDPGLNFYSSATTDTSGFAFVDPGEIEDYCKKAKKETDLYRVVIKISAKDYISKVIVQDPSFCYTQKTLRVFFLDKSGSPTANSALLGKVMGGVSDQSAPVGAWPVSNARVLLYDFPPTGLPYETVTTDKSGEFKFDPLEPKKFVISAYHPKYAETMENRQTVEINPGERVYIELYLKVIKESEDLSVLVLRPKDLSPVEGAQVTLKEPIKPDERAAVTGFNGMAWFSSVWVGQELEINISVQRKGGNKVQAQRKVKIPKNWNELSLDEQRKIKSKLIFIIDDDKNSSTPESEIIFKVVADDSNQPLENATVKIFLPEINAYLRPPAGNLASIFDPSDPESFPLFFAAVTDKKGEVVFPRDFTLSDPRKIFPDFDPADKKEIKGFKILKGGKFQFAVEKKSYEMFASSASVGLSRKIIDVRLTTLEKAKAPLVVCLVDYLSANLSPAEAIDLTGVKLEKQRRGKFVEVLTAADADKMTEVEGMKCFIFTGLAPGEYRANLTRPVSPPSEAVKFTGREAVVIFYNLCSISKSELKKYNDDIYFALQGDDEKNLYKDKKEVFERIARIVERLGGQSEMFKPVVISVGRFGNINAFALGIKPGRCRGLDNPTTIHVATELVEYFIGYGRIDEIETTIAHEYGHCVHYDFEKSKRWFGRKWAWLFEQIIAQDSNLQDCVWGAIKDGNVNIAPYAFGGHPWDNPSEMFASFFSAYFMHHDRLHDIINSNLVEGSACQNIVKYMWQLFAENVGTVYSDDAMVFSPVSGKIGKTEYSWNRIISGGWIARNYSKMGLARKARVQFERIVGSRIARSASQLRQAVSRFNDFVDKLIGRLRLKGLGSVKGVLRSSKGAPLPGVVVLVGPKAALTGARGELKINNLPVGNHKIVVKKDTNSNYSVVAPALAEVAIKKNQESVLNITVR